MSVVPSGGPFRWGAVLGCSRACETGGPDDNWTIVGAVFAPIGCVPRPGRSRWSQCFAVATGQFRARDPPDPPRRGSGRRSRDSCWAASSRSPSSWSAATSRCATSRRAGRGHDGPDRRRSTGALCRPRPTDGLLKRDPKAIAKVDDFVVSQVLPPLARPTTAPPIVRVKLWSRDGRILYSDEPRADRQAATRSGAEEQELFETGGADAEISDLTQAREPLRAPGGQAARGAHADPHARRHAGAVRDLPALRLGQRQRRRLLRALAPPLLAGLLVLLLFQVPLAWSMARRLQRGHRERERLLAQRDRGVDAGAPADRLRPARRRGAGPRRRRVRPRAAGRGRRAARRRGRGGRAARRDRHACARACATCARCSSRSTRRAWSPPGLEAALSDLLSPLRGRGHRDRAGRRRRRDGGRAGDALVYRVAREALRNAQEHAEADTVRVEVTRPDARHHAPRRHRRRPRLRRRRPRAPRGGGPRRPDAARGPRARSRAARSPSAPSPARARQSSWRCRPVIRVLLADDHGVVRDGLGRLIDGARRRRARRHGRRRRGGRRARRAS